MHAVASVEVSDTTGDARKMGRWLHKKFIELKPVSLNDSFF